MIKQRAYANSGKSVSEIGFGAWQLGNGRDWGQNMSDTDAVRLVHTAIDEGCNFFDTAPGYGLGHSEEILGIALEGYRKDVVINTKAGHDASGKTDFSAEAIRTSVEGSLRRLRTDYIDSVILHNPTSEFLRGDSPSMAELVRMKDEGKILAYGASVDSAQDMRTVLETSQGKVLEILFNIFHQDTRLAFSLVQEKGAALIIKVPLDSGWLSGKYGPDAKFSDIRSRWSADVVNRRFQLLEKIRDRLPENTPMANAALQFILAHSAVATVIPGIKNEQQLKENVVAATGTLPKHVVGQLHQLWEEELAQNPLPW
jgi:aryl-alcohol dehydrogenase-like predicted oxidoreductase